MSNRRLKTTEKSSEFLPIPDKLYFTIGEAAKLSSLQTHVLRYWEQEFSQLTPSKRRGNRRYYQPKDLLLIRKIKELLYDRGYTIEGARQQLSDKKNSGTVQGERASMMIKSTISSLKSILVDLET